MSASTGQARREHDGVAVRKRNALRRGGLVFGLFILYPVLATLTSVLDGMVAGVSVAYLVGFLEIAFGLLITLIHVRRASQFERE